MVRPKENSRLRTKWIILNLKIGVCGKALYYYNEDFSSRLIEWIEILKLFGIDQIFLYKTTCHENVTKVLEHYEKDGFVRLTTFYYPPPYGQDGTFTSSMKVGKKPGTYLFQWKNFYQNLKPGPSAENIPQEFYNLRHNKRTKLDAKEAPVLENNGKSITPNIQRVKRKYAYMGHFSIHTCRKETLCSEEDTEEELFLIRYKDVIMKNVIK
ncbi:Inactive tyrosine-protein kinase transmembrane receptor ROR1 [Armadillidium nasatum]|uniref:Glycosyltransferase family 92 protein n=1 Tax=Armadillidium nasatum TaxID=96803 RepID=A0A5N5SZ42_9CRUS|nr:Inactive tyrosine-protein kinase transmembrane receptor ROR1 [Armadillidium nasatum]